MNVYEERGFTSRHDYLKSLAEDFGLPFSTVSDMAETIGEREDFDALITFLNDLPDRNE